MSGDNFDLINQVYEYIKDEDYESAYEIISANSEKGIVEFEHLLGAFYMEGRFVELDYDKAIFWLSRSASKSYSNSQALLGRILTFHEGEIRDISEGIKWLKKSADSDNDYACTLLGEVYAKGMSTGTPDYVTAAKFFTKGSELGSIESKQKLAYYYSNGLGVTKDESKSFTLNLEAANGDNIDAALNLAINYEYGKGTEKNSEEAFRWYFFAAKAGNVLAQHNLGAAYAKGSGTPIDFIEAQFWYLTAAKQGSYLSQQCLGYMYEQGQGVLQDLTIALSWYLIANTNYKNSDLDYSIEKIENKLSKIEIEKANKISEEFISRENPIKIFDKQKQTNAIEKGVDSYENGRFEAAYEELRMPAHQGNIIACRFLGFIFKYGMGQERDYSEAVKYF